MIVLINGGPALDRFGASPYVGRLVSPRSGNRVRPGQTWAADNDALKAWSAERFLWMLCRLEDAPRNGCLFVAAPDVVTMTDDDRRIGDPVEMLASCAKFIEWRCDVGGWRSYRQLEQESLRLKQACEALIRTARTAPMVSFDPSVLVSASSFRELQRVLAEGLRDE